MSSLSFPASSSIVTLVAGRILEVPVRPLKTLLRELATRKAIAELRSWNDRMLADVGLSRSDITFVVTRRGADPTRIPR